jgi:hypothetical protein
MIRIDENYFITNDNMNWILNYEGKPRVKNLMGKVQLVTPKEKWYYSTLTLALKAYCGRSLKPAESITQVLSKIDELHLHIRSLHLDTIKKNGIV